MIGRVRLRQIGLFAASPAQGPHTKASPGFPLLSLTQMIKQSLSPPAMYKRYESDASLPQHDKVKEVYPNWQLELAGSLGHFNKPLISFNFNSASTGVNRLISMASSMVRISSKVWLCASNILSC